MPINPTNGVKFTEEQFFDYIRKDLALFLPKFHNYPGPSFQAHEQIDEGNWKQFNPVGAVMQFNIDANPLEAYTYTLPIPEWGLVLCAELEKDKTNIDFRWKFVTLQGPNPYGYHPVSGTREFGFRRKGQAYEFYLRAADRVTTFIDYPGSYFVFRGAELYWNNFFKNLLSFIEKNKGVANIKTPYSKRHPWNL